MLCFTGNVSDNWNKWIQRFRLFAVASGLDKKDEAIKVSTLLHVAGEDAIDIYNTFEYTNAGDNLKFDTVIQKFEEYCAPRKNITWERHVFNTRTQQRGENIDYLRHRFADESEIM